ncbi:MAG: 30S ribosomal protein S8, partial [Clostridiaceae bacterium]|nr:30S ribosomal protein S8 [Clostridiaceae bacterium]
MQITDSIADMLTRIRNAGTSGHTHCEIPASKVKLAIAQILLEEGYINRIESIADDKQGMIRITLKYAAKKPVIS